MNTTPNWLNNHGTAGVDADLNKWLWLDLEMTGLDPVEDVIIEAAAIVTDTELNELANWHSVIHQPEEALNKMKQSQWYENDEITGKRELKGSVYDMHASSGVLEAVRNDSQAESEAVEEFVKFIEANFSGAAILAGNSIHQDRRFIRSKWPEVEAKLHYQMIDVTTFKIVMRSLGITDTKDKAHNALDDIRASIEELRKYISHVTTT